MKDDRSNIINEPVEFLSEELFFSKTDDKGIILTGNEVFRRISQYSWEELVNKPHNIIRHPHMPKAVFWLLWDVIRKGQPIGAYVKNRSKDGRYYWVFAIVTPVDGGYLSVRIKPESEILGVVDTEYKNLRELDLNSKMSPQESGEKLLACLSRLGFDSYLSFMSSALAREVELHDKLLKRKPDGRIGRFVKLVAQASELLKQAETIFSAYNKSQYVPLNLRVRAAQLCEAGATIGVISKNYTIISDEIKNSMSQFVTSAQKVKETIMNGLFLICVAKIQHEIVDVFYEEAKLGGEESKEDDITLLEGQEKEYSHKAMRELTEILTKADSFSSSCKDMKRLSSGLEVTRMMGKMESSRLGLRSSGLNELIDDLDQFQVAITEGLITIEDINKSIVYEISRLKAL